MYSRVAEAPPLACKKKLPAVLGYICDTILPIIPSKNAPSRYIQWVRNEHSRFNSNPNQAVNGKIKKMYVKA